MIWAEARDVLSSHGMHVELRAYGLKGWSDTAEGRQVFHAGGSHQEFGGVSGVEVSVSQQASDGRSSGGTVRWFFRPTVSALTDLLLGAHLRVLTGVSTSLLDALQEIDR